MRYARKVVRRVPEYKIAKNNDNKYLCLIHVNRNFWGSLRYRRYLFRICLARRWNRTAKVLIHSAVIFTSAAVYGAIERNDASESGSQIDSILSCGIPALSQTTTREKSPAQWGSNFTHTWINSLSYLLQDFGVSSVLMTWCWLWKMGFSSRGVIVIGPIELEVWRSLEIIRSKQTKMIYTDGRLPWSRLPSILISFYGPW